MIQNRGEDNACQNALIYFHQMISNSGFAKLHFLQIQIRSRDVYVL